MSKIYYSFIWVIIVSFSFSQMSYAVGTKVKPVQSINVMAGVVDTTDTEILQIELSAEEIDENNKVRRIKKIFSRVFIIISTATLLYAFVVFSARIG